MGKITRTLLILTTNYDVSTTKTLMWIKHLYPCASVYCLTSNDLKNCMIDTNCAASSFSIKTPNGKVFDSNHIAVVWTRRWDNSSNEIYSNSLDKRQLSDCKSCLKNEFNAFFQFIIFSISNNTSAFWFNHPDYTSPNKLVQLSKAKEIGFVIPKSWVTNYNSQHLNGLNCITKPMSYCFSIKYKKTFYTNYTSKLIGKESYDDLFISFVQENIPKEAEVRVFYILGKCYALLIHSQHNKKTQTDYRKYDYKHPNRLEPCQLPPDIESKIDAFMHAMNLQTGSLDFILTPSGEYVFLEVNPCGQYDIFNSCNIYPDKLIAEALISKLQ